MMHKSRSFATVLPAFANSLLNRNDPAGAASCCSNHGSRPSEGKGSIEFERNPCADWLMELSMVVLDIALSWRSTLYLRDKAKLVATLWKRAKNRLYSAPYCFLVQTSGLDVLIDPYMTCCSKGKWCDEQRVLNVFGLWDLSMEGMAAANQSGRDGELCWNEII